MNMVLHSAHCWAPVDHMQHLSKQSLQPLSQESYALCYLMQGLRTEMSILRVDKMRPLFQEVIVTKLVVTQCTK